MSDAPVTVETLSAFIAGVEEVAPDEPLIIREPGNVADLLSILRDYRRLREAPRMRAVSHSLHEQNEDCDNYECQHVVVVQP